MYNRMFQKRSSPVGGDLQLLVNLKYLVFDKANMLRSLEVTCLTLNQSVLKCPVSQKCFSGPDVVDLRSKLS